MHRPLRTRLDGVEVPPAPAPDATPLLLGLAEAARRLAIAPRTLRRIAAEGRIPYARIGRALRFRPGDLEAFVEGSVVGGRPLRRM